MTGEKRSRSDAAAPTVATSTAAVDRMSEAAMRAVLKTLVQTSADARAAVAAKSQADAAKPVDLSYYAIQTADAVTMLDGMPPSRQYGETHRIKARLNVIVKEAQNLPPAHAFQALAVVAQTIVDEAEGEVWKSMRCGGPFGGIAEALMEAKRGLGAGGKEKFPQTVARLRSVHHELCENAVVHFAEVLSEDEDDCY